MKERLGAMRKAFDKKVKENETAMAKSVSVFNREFAQSNPSVGSRPVSRVL